MKNPKTKLTMNDLLPHKHGDEGEGSTHSCCPEISKKMGGKTICCECTGHDCQPMEIDNWEKRFDNQFTMAIDVATKTKVVSRDIKEFIHTLLSEVVEEIIGKAEKGTNGLCVSCCSYSRWIS